MHVEDVQDRRVALIAPLRWLACLALGACGGAGTATLVAAPAAGDGPCELVQAMLAIDNPGYQRLYATCGKRTGPPLVELVAQPALIPADLTCPGRPFGVFHGDPAVRGPVIVLNVGQRDGELRFSASLRDPNGTPTADGGFDVSNYYCGAIEGHVELRGGRWHAWAPRAP